MSESDTSFDFLAYMVLVQIVVYDRCDNGDFDFLAYMVLV